MNKELSINLTPSRDHLNVVEGWLIKELDDTGEGFYKNWNIIEKAFSKGRLITFIKDKNPVGFMTWVDGGLYVEIDIFEIQFDFRRRGLGRVYFNLIFEYFKSQNYLAVKLFCMPQESEHFWRSMGFKDFPKFKYAMNELTLFKELISSLKPKEDFLAISKIEIWDLETYQINDKKPKWIWQIEDDRSFKPPILIPYYADWHIRLTIDGEILEEGKIKYLDEKYYDLDCGVFFYLENLIGID